MILCRLILTPGKTSHSEAHKSVTLMVKGLTYISDCFMYSHFKHTLIKSYYIKISDYCYHLVNVITFSVAQSDHIKRLLLY